MKAVKVVIHYEDGSTQEISAAGALNQTFDGGIGGGMPPPTPPHKPQ